MSFWDKLLKWLGWGRRKTDAAGTTEAEKAEEAADSSTEEPIAERKVTTTMLNSITLSSDMEVLYLIDNGRAIPFKLSAAKGILIGTLGKQLVVATAVDSPEAPEPPSGGAGSGDAGAGAERTASAARNLITRPKPTNEFKLPITGKRQWTLVYNKEHEVLAVIGVGDITSGIVQPQPARTEGTVFSIGAKPLNIRREDDVIILSQEAEAVAEEPDEDE